VDAQRASIEADKAADPFVWVVPAIVQKALAAE
jgi:hypothetical protein